MTIRHVIFVPDHHDLLRGTFGSRPPHAFRRAEVVDEHVSSNDPTCPIPCCVECGEWWPCPTPGIVVSRTPAHWAVAKDSAHAYWNRESAALVLAWDRAMCYAGQHWLAEKADEGQAWVQEVVRSALFGQDSTDALSDHGLPGTVLLLDEGGVVMKSYPGAQP
jgi:hypothetical protein